MRWAICVLCAMGCGSQSNVTPDAVPPDAVPPDAAPVCHVPAVTTDVVGCPGIGYGLPAVGIGEAHVMSRLADVNGDGKLDVIAPVLAPNGGVSVALGHGDGTFAAPVTYPAGGQPVGVAVGDLNGDGAPDLAVVSQSDDVVFVLTNQGAGTFGAPTSIAVAAGPRAVVMGDLEQDGDLDIVVASYTANSITILRNTGTGAFAAPTTLTTASPWRLALGRLDSDSYLALVLVGFSTMYVFRNAGDGTFPAGTAIMNGGAGDVAIADFNGDGQGDVAVTQSSGIAIYAGTGNAGLDLPASYSFSGASLTTGDFDGNGKVDIVAVGWDGVSVLLRGATAFTQTTEPHQSPAQGNDAVAAGDIDGDGDLDLAIAGVNNRDNGIALLRNPGNGVFLETTLLDSSLTAAVGEGDVDGDGKSDVIYASPDRLHVYVNGQPTADHALGAFAYSIAVGDVSGDAIADVIVSTDRDLQVFIASGGGALRPAVVYATGVESFEMTLVDLDSDGDRDIVLPHPLPPMPKPNMQTVGILLNQSNGTFDAQQTYPIGGTMAGAAVADFDGDCNLDIVVANQPPGLALLRGVGDGTFAPAQPVPSESPFAVGTTDVDGDDKSDLIVLSEQKLAVLRGRGDGMFEQLSVTPTIGYTVQAPLRVVDFDGDGRHDVVVVNDLGLAVHHGNADGTFAPASVYNMTGRPWLAGDLDGDHRLDLLVTAGGQTQNAFRLYKVLASCAP